MAARDSSSLRTFPIKRWRHITQKQEQRVRGLDLCATTSFLGLCLFTPNTESVLSAVGLFVPPTISSLIASPNHEAGQYFRANVLCKFCHSFPSLELISLGSVYQNWS